MKESGKRKGDDQLLTACAESGSLRVKIMRLDKPHQPPGGFTHAHGNMNPGHAQAAFPHASAQHGSLQGFTHLPPAQQAGLSSTLGPPPGGAPPLGVQNSLLGGGIQQLPSMVVDTRNFNWLPGQQGAPSTGRPRGGSLPNYTIDPSLYYSNASHVRREA